MRNSTIYGKVKIYSKKLSATVLNITCLHFIEVLHDPQLFGRLLRLHLPQRLMDLII